ncbi:hypothetical protein JTE90_002240 [Oedothorax gibbosus]|uniref:mRNA-decapping enzyme C-terminal domain-containing protein n=1 Tax=Oedothorax gibbosus TaxID=931172 RepID=A0AAV6V7W8_9ARAC|nr:hypothetical protein JTE90_002240 [Oedothorax gibbosus]
MANSEALKINLAALRKVDSSISSIVDSENQVALYKYISDAGKWEKTDIEGTLFVYMRAQKPHHGFMIMNRLSTTNLVESITEKLDFQDQTPFLLYRNGKGSIYGVWFYEEKNCQTIFKLLSSLSQLAFTKPDKSNNIRQRSYSESNRKQQKQNNTQMDILSLLAKAQDEYDKKSATKDYSSRGPKTNSSNGDIVKPTPVRVNGTVTTPSKTTPLTIGTLFAQAGGIEKKPNEDAKDFDTRVRSFTASTCNSIPNTSQRKTETILQSVLSNSAHTLQHIEGMQKSGEESEKHGQMLSLETLEKDLKATLNLLPEAKLNMWANSTCDVASDLCELSKEPAKSNPIDIPILPLAMLESLSNSSVPTSAVVGSFLDKSEKFCEPNNVSLIKESGSFPPSQLLSPMYFTSTGKKFSHQSSLLPSSYSPEPGSTMFNGNGSMHEHLLPSHSLLNGPIAGHLQPAGKPSSVTPLNKDQFKEALVYMIQNDDAFVIQLHECYVKSLKTQLNSLSSS